MAWDGGGNFDRTQNFSADASAGLQATAAKFDDEFNNFKTGLETTLAGTGETSPSANLPMAGNRHTGVGAATSAQEYLRADQATQQTGIYFVGLMTGQVCSVSATVFPAALTDGMRVYIKPNANFELSASGSTGTLIINGLTADMDAGYNTVIASQSAYFQAVYRASDNTWVQSDPRPYNIQWQSLIRGSDDNTFSDTSATFEGFISNNIVTVMLNSSITISASTTIDNIYINSYPPSLRHQGGIGFEFNNNAGFVRVNTSSGIQMGYAGVQGNAGGGGTMTFYLNDGTPMESNGPIVLCPFTLTFNIGHTLSD